MTALNSSVERIQATFLNSIFAIPHCVPYAVLGLESGVIRLETIAWLCSFLIQISNTSKHDPLNKDMLSNSLLPYECKQCLQRVKTMGIGGVTWLPGSPVQTTPGP